MTCNSLKKPPQRPEVAEEEGEQEEEEQEKEEEKEEHFGSEQPLWIGLDWILMLRNANNTFSHNVIKPRRRRVLTYSLHYTYQSRM